MYSIYHFFQSLLKDRSKLVKVKKLGQFPFDDQMLSCRNKGVFPDLAIRLNKERKDFTGGELVELKDNKTYTVASFNSTIPSGSKAIADIITGKQSKVRKEMEKAGNNVFSLPKREVYYLVRGKRRENTKACLLHGSFFETVATKDLISQSFAQVLEERLQQSGVEVPFSLRQKLASLFSEQESFSKVRIVNKASVTLRFRIMTEIQAEGNILNPKTYPEIKDNTLSFVLPCHNDSEEHEIRRKSALVFTRAETELFRIFKLKHHFNGWFLVFQTDI